MEIELGEDMLDSRDVIEKFEELTSTKNELEEAVQSASEACIKANLKRIEAVHSTLEEILQEAYDEAVEALEEAEEAFQSFIDDSEYELWAQLVEEGESAPDWSYGECLILDSYFVEYTESLVRDCWELPKEFDSNQWPWNHLTIDWESAADQLKDDYIEINVGEEYTYWIRG